MELKEKTINRSFTITLMKIRMLILGMIRKRFRFYRIGSYIIVVFKVILSKLKKSFNSSIFSVIFNKIYSFSLKDVQYILK